MLRRRSTDASLQFSFLCCLAAVLVGVLGVAHMASAQATGNATLRGTVTDTTGAVMPGATVVVTSVGTRESREAVTDGRGGYIFAGLFPGTYTLRVTLEGFKSHEQTNIVLSPNDTRGIDVTLEVGELTDVITVTATRDIIQTETGAREGVVTAEQIDNLSIMGRSALELLRIMPGVVAPDAGVLENVGFLVGGNNTMGYNVNGIRSTNNVVNLDGANLIDIGSNNGVILSPNSDMVQEVKVQSSNFAAEFGASGMQVSAITKAGTAEFRGTFYDYVRHHRFAANDRSNAIAGVEKPRSEFQYPGGNIGGPVIIPGTGFNQNRDKMFFFFGVEVQRQKMDPGSTFGVVPSLRQRQGDFSENLACIGQNLNQPCSAPLIPGGFPNEGQPAPGGILTPYIHPIGAQLIQFYPAPNYVDANNRYNYVFNQLEPNNRYELISRLDYNVTDSTKAYVRVAYQSETREEARGIWWPASAVALPTPNLAESNGRGMSANVVSVLGQSMTNELLISYAKLKLDNDYKDPSRVSKAALGIPDLGFFPNASPYVPLQFINDWGANQVSNLWSPTSNFIYAYNDTRLISNKLTWIWNSHAFKFGGGIEQVNKWQNFQNDEHMLMVYDAGWTPGETGHQIGDLLVGRPAWVQQGTPIPDGHFRLWNIDAFAQDSWKIRPNFTLEYGARFSFMPNNQELNDLGVIFDPSFYDPNQGAYLEDGTRYNGVRYVARGEVPRRLTRNRTPYLMPRVNFAWDLAGDGMNVIRGGYGHFVNRPMGNTVYDVLRVPPNTYMSSVDGWGGFDLGGGTGLTYDTIRLFDPFNNLTGLTDLLSIDPNSINYPETHSFSLSYGRRIFWDQVVEAGYVGTRGRRLVSRSHENVVPLGTLNQGMINDVDLSIPAHRVALDGSLVNQFRPYPTHQTVLFWNYHGESNYDSLQITLSRQTGRTLQYFGNYTLGRAKGHLGGEYTQFNPIFPDLSYGTLEYDRRHIINLSYNWFAPDLSPSPNLLARGLLNGWQLSGISTFSSGYPIFLNFSGDIAGATMSRAWYGTPDATLWSGGTTAISPVYTCDPRNSGSRSVGDKLFDINCIAIPGFGETGQWPLPYDLRAPWRWNHDITVFKNFRVTDTQRLQFRFGMFNLFHQAFASQRFTNDIDLALQTTCNRRVMAPTGTGQMQEVCDPTGGFEFTQLTKENFGNINLLRGRRVIEFALKYYF
jgi:hypothetical protein